MREVHKQQVEADRRGTERTRAGTYTPRIDIVETDTELVLYADLPGVAPDQLDVRYEEGQLTIHGRVGSRQGNVEYAAQEYGVGDFHRVFAIGETIDSTRIAAELRHGVLVLHLPKVARAQPRRIPVQAV